MALTLAQAPISWEISHSFPHVLAHTDSLASPSAHSSPKLASSSSVSPSLYVTLKVLQLVKSFQRRIKTRVHSQSPRRASVHEDFCQDFERQAFDEIDKYLGRKTSHPNSKRTKASGGELSSSRPKSLAESFAATDRSEEEVRSPNSIEWLLSEVNITLIGEQYSLSELSARNKLFLKRNTDFRLKPLSAKELAHALVAIKDLIETLRRAAPPNPSARAFPPGKGIVDPALDLTYIANLEHLLLCLQDQIIHLLVARGSELVQKHLIECQKDRDKHVKEWFCEYPDARHPLSTTWPWSIKPSLAVIWGVCWMFYDYNCEPRFDNQMNMVDVQGRVVVPSHVVQEILSGRQREMQQYASLVNRQDYGPAQMPRYSPSRMPISTQPPPQATQARISPIQNRHAADTAPHGLARQGGNTYTTSAAPPSAYAGAEDRANNGWPEVDRDFATGFDDNAYAAGTWHQPAQIASNQVLQQPGVRYREHSPQARDPLTPEIRVTTDFPHNLYPPQPQAHFSSSSSQNSPHDQSPSHYTFDPRHLSPPTYDMAPEISDNMQTPPVSPSVQSARSPAGGVAPPGPMSRKRSYSEISQGQGPPMQIVSYSRPASVASVTAQSQASPGDYSPASGPRTLKRGDPPENQDGKYICNFDPPCGGQIFDRKCEWSKHMDKHDRPYHCQDPSCAKLQGFTYSGGLLRHEREVHKKHGGPKSRLMCPHEDCPRHCGKGFTRKENLAEHVRRVHTTKEDAQSAQLKQDAVDALASAQMSQAAAVAQLPASRIDESLGEQVEELVGSPALKKQRCFAPEMSERSASEDVEDLRSKLRMLQAENEAKDERIRRMEQVDLETQERLRRMEDALSGMQNGGRREH